MNEKERVSSAPTPLAGTKVEEELTEAEIFEALTQELAGVQHGTYEAEPLNEAENAYLIDLAKAYPEPRYTLKLNDVGTLPLGDLAAIKAKSKNGKSYLCSIFMASLLGDERFGLISQMEQPTVIYYDTEQNSRNTARVARRVHTLLGWPTNANNERFVSYSLRSMCDDERLPFITRAISKWKPQAVVIDGVADLIPNFNDVEQSARLILDLMRLSANNDCCIICVLHENKAKDDTGMKGHLGTLLLQKCSDVYQVKKDGLMFQVTQTDSRNEPVAGFSFLIDGMGIPYPGQAPGVVRLEEKERALRKVLAQAFSAKPEQIKEELANNIAGYEGVSETTAKRRVADALKMELIKYEPSTRKYTLVD